MSKKKYYRSITNQNEEYTKIVQAYRNKYFNLYRAQFKWTGLTYRQEDYIMRKFYGSGTVAAFKIKGIDELGFAPWTLQTWDMYDLPETVSLINEHNSPLVPSRDLIVDKECVIGYIQRNKKSIQSIVNWYIDRIAQVEMVIITNLQLHKMPYLIPVDEEDSEKIEDIVTKILNNELVLFAKGVDPNLFRAVATGAPYIIDKLCEYKQTLENDLNTYLGIDNAGSVQKAEQVNMDELNANNDEINDSENNFLDSLQEFCKGIKETFNIDISVEPTSKPVNSIGEVHEGNTPGPKGDEDNENN